MNLNNGGLAISYNGNATLTGNRILTSTGASATSLNGIMNDGGAGYGFTKEGNGTLSLTAANTHSGITAVNDGTLALGHVNAVQHSTLDAGAGGAQAVTFTVLPAVPEPSTWVAMAALAITGGTMAMRRRSRQATEIL